MILLLHSASYQYAVFGEKLELLEDFKSDSMPILRDIEQISSRIFIYTK